MEWNIVTDSSCDLVPEAEQPGRVRLSSVPFTIRIGGTEFVDDEALDTQAFLTAMENCTTAGSTACPPPQSWVEQFTKAEKSIAIAISSRLSGSMSSAVTAKWLVLEKYPDKQIEVLDSASAGPELVLCVEKIQELIGREMDFDQIVSEAKAFLKRTHVVFALCSFDNLIKNGRMRRITGFLARKLGMWGIGVGNDIGDIVIKGKTRGAAKAIAAMLEDMQEHNFRGGKVVISHCQNYELAQKLKNRIQAHWQNSTVRILPTRGLCSFYAEKGGLILSY